MKKRENEELKASKVVLVSGGVGDPSSTQMLGAKIAKATLDIAKKLSQSHGLNAGSELVVREIKLKELAKDLSAATVTGMKSSALIDAFEEINSADGLIVASPVYKASYSGLFKMFFDLMDDDALLAMPVVLAATAGTPRHALVPDEQMRPLFAYLRAIVTPTSVFAATEDWGGNKLQERIDRAAVELVGLVESDVRGQILTKGINRYRTVFRENARSGQEEVDFDTELMKLAAGGK